MAYPHHEHQTNGQKKPQVLVVIVPFPAQGHLNQLLHLSDLISSYNMPVHYVSTTTHNRQAKSRVQGRDPLSKTNIHFHEFPTPSFLNAPPNLNNDSSTKFPTHLLPLFKSSLLLREPVGNLLQTLSRTAQRIVVIHDALMTSVVQDVVDVPNAEAYNFQASSAFFFFSYIWEIIGRPSLKDEALSDLPTTDSCFPPEMLERVTAELAHKFVRGTIYDVSKVIEGNYFDLLKKEEYGGNSNQWALGPFNPVALSSHNKINSSNQRHGCLNWLDKQAPNSVIYVSFGSTTSFSNEQIHQLAIGLEESGQKFIWVLREADRGDIFEGNDHVNNRCELPKGYEERIQGKGIIVRDWAPQLEILAHPSTGGFTSHCGWNSCTESITMGVPIAAWPMHSDQPRNAVLIIDTLKIGTFVRGWAQRDELVTSIMVENAVRRLMASKDGDEMRNRAVELGGAVRRSVEEGGVTRAELESFVAHITRI